MNFFRFPCFLVFFALLLCSCESKKTIYSHLNEQNANEILALLSDSHINASKVASLEEISSNGTTAILWDILVDQNKADRAIIIVKQNGLPRLKGQNPNLFKETGLIPSEHVQKQRYFINIANEIATSLKKIDGIIDAEIEISFPDENPLNSNESLDKTTSASVFIKHTGVLDDPNSNLIPKIKSMLTAKVHRLDPDKITVTGEKISFRALSPSNASFFSEIEKQFMELWEGVVSNEPTSLFRILLLSLSFAFLLFAVVKLIQFFRNENL